jgi:hypothetical protein
MLKTLVGRHNKKGEFIGEDGSRIYEYSGIFFGQYNGQKFLLQTLELPLRVDVSNNNMRIIYPLKSYRVSRISGKREWSETTVYDIEELPVDEQTRIFKIISAVNF